eukprot:TRINITY_DN12631_c0_g1_i1.p1 TRINITY_DN12631_c0_g1~~TRINITY_DN12631_c0_g1_i1.p1  ORF type:complete len:1023 (+),score=195.53 TRINITY_DN12631_c0_g1_i1:1318-4386(+)
MRVVSRLRKQRTEAQEVLSFDKASYSLTEAQKRLVKQVFGPPMQCGSLAAVAGVVLIMLRSVCNVEEDIHAVVAVVLCSIPCVFKAESKLSGAGAMGHVYCFIPSGSAIGPYITPDCSRTRGTDVVCGPERLLPACDGNFAGEAKLNTLCATAVAKVLGNSLTLPASLLLLSPPVLGPDPPCFARSVVNIINRILCQPQCTARVWGYTSKSAPMTKIHDTDNWAGNEAGNGAGPFDAKTLPASCHVVMSASCGACNVMFIALSGNPDISLARSSVLNLCQIRKTTATEFPAVISPLSLLIKDNMKQVKPKITTVMLMNHHLDTDEKKATKSMVKQTCRSLGIPYLKPRPSLFHTIKIALLFRRLSASRRMVTACVVKHPVEFCVAGDECLSFMMALKYKSGAPVQRELPYHATAYLEALQGPCNGRLIGETRVWIERGKVFFDNLAVTSPGVYVVQVVFNLCFKNDDNIDVLCPITCCTRAIRVADSCATLAGLMQARMGVSSIDSDAMKLVLKHDKLFSEKETKLEMHVASRYDPSVTLLVDGVVHLAMSKAGAAPLPAALKRRATESAVKRARRSFCDPDLTERKKSYGMGMQTVMSLRAKPALQDLLNPTVNTSVLITNGRGVTPVKLASSGKWVAVLRLESISIVTGCSVGLHSVVNVAMHPLEEWKTFSMKESVARMEIAKSHTTHTLMLDRKLWILLLCWWHGEIWKFECFKNEAVERTGVLEEHHRFWLTLLGEVEVQWVREELRTWDMLNKGIPRPVGLCVAKVGSVVMEEPFELSVRVVMRGHGKNLSLMPSSSDAVLLQLCNSTTNGGQMKMCVVSPFMHFDGKDVAHAQIRLSHAGSVAFRAVIEFSSPLTHSLVSDIVQVLHRPSKIVLQLMDKEGIVKYKFRSRDLISGRVHVYDSNNELCREVHGEAFLATERLVHNQWKQCTLLPALATAHSIHNGRGKVSFPRHIFACSPTGTYRFVSTLGDIRTPGHSFTLYTPSFDFSESLPPEKVHAARMAIEDLQSNIFGHK